MSDAIYIILIIIFATIVPILYKCILNELPAHTVFVLSYIFISVLIFIYIIFNWNSLNFHTEKLTFKVILQLFFVVLLGSMISNYLYYNVLAKNDAYYITILIAISPIFTAILAYYFLNERISITTWIGIVLVVTGLILVAYK